MSKPDIFSGTSEADIAQRELLAVATANLIKRSAVTGFSSVMNGTAAIGYANAWNGGTEVILKGYGLSPTPSDSIVPTVWATIRSGTEGHRAAIAVTQVADTRAQTLKTNVSFFDSKDFHVPSLADVLLSKRKKACRQNALDLISSLIVSFYNGGNESLFTQLRVRQRELPQ